MRTADACAPQRHALPRLRYKNTEVCLWPSSASENAGDQGPEGTSRERTILVKRASGRATALAATAALLGSLLAATPAAAGLDHEFSVFADCPLSNPKVAACVYSKVTSGSFTLGSKTVPIDKPVILQGGTTAGSNALVPAADGDTLSATSLTVPGGLVGIEGLGGEVTATAELAGTVQMSASNLLLGKGTAVTLPLEVRLGNPLLGEACYIGSSSEPVEPQLTSGATSPPGPNKPISGSPGRLARAGNGNIVVVEENTLVDNAFAVPGANGCGGLLSLVLDPLVDASAGVPASAGHNTAILGGVLETAAANVVRAQQALPEIGRCVPAPSSGEGKAKVYEGDFLDSGCTVEENAHLGRYEWLPGPGAKRRFAGSAGKVTLEGAAGGKVTCSAATLDGEYTGAKTLTAAMAMTGCKRLSTKEACQSGGAQAGEIVAGGVAGQLGFVEDVAVEGGGVKASVGLVLSGSPDLLSARCGGVAEALTVSGSAIAPIGKLDRDASAFTAKFKAAAGAQQPERFEEGPPETLTATMGSGAEAAGLSMSVKLSGEEPLEIKAEQQ